MVRLGTSRFINIVGRLTCTVDVAFVNIEELPLAVCNELLLVGPVVAFMMVFGGKELMAAPNCCCFLTAAAALDPPIVGCHWKLVSGVPAEAIVCSEYLVDLKAGSAAKYNNFLGLLTQYDNYTLLKLTSCCGASTFHGRFNNSWYFIDN